MPPARRRAAAVRAAKKQVRLLRKKYPNVVVMGYENACYPCISAWAYGYKPDFGEKPDFNCAQCSPNSSRCGAEKDGAVPAFGCCGNKKTCSEPPAMLAADHVFFGKVFEFTCSFFWSVDDDDEYDIPLEGRKMAGSALLSLATSFCRFVESHRSEFGIAGTKKNNKADLSAYQDKVLAREANLKMGFARLAGNANVASRQVGTALGLAGVRYLEDGEWEDLRARLGRCLAPYGMGLYVRVEQVNAGRPGNTPSPPGSPSPAPGPLRDAMGRLLAQFGDDGMLIEQFDDLGNVLPQYDEDGNLVDQFDDDGNLLQFP
ncbi:uncharacterized protein PG986_005548 [Apiospora aurea]|uniref:Uncharacterized protein n=1 Tax=Apiospora aurea TaxID=335848 RepID=A0ABR1PTC8_9PEZI